LTAAMKEASGFGSCPAMQSRVDRIEHALEILKYLGVPET
jgi:hypothetical protein